MIQRPLRLPEARRREFEDQLEAFSERRDERVRSLLDEVELDSVRRQLDTVVFSPNSVLPKRERRPAMKLPFVAEQLYRASASDLTSLDPFVEFAILSQEYYDIFDDLLDGDVADGRDVEVYLTKELLVPLLSRLLSRLGESATAYWTDNAFTIVESAIDGLTASPDADAYVSILGKQATLYGSITGLAAITSSADDATIETYERLGSAFYEYEQLLLDLEQYEGDDSDPWNAWELMADEDVYARLRSRQSEVIACLDGLPDERPRSIRPFVTVDVEQWRASLS